MSRFVVTAPAMLSLAEAGVRDPAPHELLAPTLVRSQTLSMLYAAVRAGALEERTARERLTTITEMKVRLLGDRVLKAEAWRVAARLDWADTFAAEYVALARLKAAALVTDDPNLAEAVAGLVDVAPVALLFTRRRA